MKKSTDARLKASAKYDKVNTRSVFLKLNVKTDSDILEYLDSVDNKQGLIKALIRQHMNGGDQPETPRKRILDGDFIEGEYVTVLIDGEKHKRKVKRRKDIDDLFITVLGIDHTMSEFK